MKKLGLYSNSVPKQVASTAPRLARSLRPGALPVNPKPGLRRVRFSKRHQSWPMLGSARQDLLQFRLRPRRESSGLTWHSARKAGFAAA